MTATSIELWAPFLVAALIAAAVTPLAILIAPKIGAMDIPKDNRRVHNKPMPRFGGIAIFAGMIIAWAIFAVKNPAMHGVMVGSAIIYILGAVDDLKNLRPLVKFSGQLLAAIVAFALGLRIQFITNWFGSGNMIFGDVACFIITVIWLVAITNAVNLIDGLDGLAAGIAAISALCLAYVAYIHGQYTSTIALMVLAGSAVGFLPFNFNPARIFMGDGGSQLLGFAIAAVSIMGAVKSATLVVVLIPALVLGLPIFDTLMAIIRRTARHQSIGTADKEHLHHRILKAGFGQRRAVLLMYCVSGIMGIMAILYSRSLYVECIGLLGIAVIIVGVIMTDTGHNKVSLRGMRLKKEDLSEEDKKYR
ncbi:MAG: MraY family glycosyltransferase [Bacillota bacterium]|nr:MraY family glycosyltransferase [Bacillota bacterium]